MRVTTLIICALCAIMPSFAQKLNFSYSSWDFGPIEEMGGSVSHSFKLKNDGGKPLVIYNIRSSCGCTTAGFSTEPIFPGDSSTIVVTYDPINRPGAFMRDLYIYSTASKEPEILRITGTVESKTLTFEQRYPFVMGEQLRVSVTNPSVGIIQRSLMTSAKIQIVNVSADELKVELRERHPNDLLHTGYEEVLSPAESAVFEVGYLIGINDKVDAGDDGRIADTLDLYINGVNSGKWLRVSGIVTK